MSADRFERALAKLARSKDRDLAWLSEALERGVSSGGSLDRHIAPESALGATLAERVQYIRRDRLLAKVLAYLDAEGASDRAIASAISAFGRRWQADDALAQQSEIDSLLRNAFLVAAKYGLPMPTSRGGVQALRRRLLSDPPAIKAPRGCCWIEPSQSRKRFA